MSARKIYVIFTIFLFSTSIYAQQENKKDSISIDKEHPLHKFQDLKLPDSIRVDLETEQDYKADAQELHRREVFVRSLMFLAPELYQGPIADPLLAMGYKSKVLTFTQDYSFDNVHQLEEDIQLQTNSSKRTYSELGVINAIQANVYYQPFDWLTMSGGVYASKYSIWNKHYNDMGFNASMRFKLHDRIYLRAHGMYSINSNDKKRFYPPSAIGLYPQTYFGGGIEFKVTEKFGVEGGMIRELNPMNGKWQNRPYIMPIFYSTGWR